MSTLSNIDEGVKDYIASFDCLGVYTDGEFYPLEHWWNNSISSYFRMLTASDVKAANWYPCNDGECSECRTMRLARKEYFFLLEEK